MPDKLQVSIIGLGLIGASAGLALRRHADRVTVVGHDPNPTVAGAAKKAGAVDRTEWNLINAISGADRVLLALPLDQVRDTLKAVAQDLKPGCVIVDTADVKVPANAAAAELLPKGVHFVGGHPILIPANMDPGKATADLFDNKLFCLTPDAGTDSAAVHLAADLVEALGAKPFFLDPVEHDGMAAAVSQLPQLLAAALMDVASRSPSWQDMRKLAGGQFYSSTLITEGNGRSVVAGLTANREHVMLWLDELTARLAEWRQALTDGKEDAVAAAIDDGLAAGEKWMEANILGRWEEERESRADAHVRRHVPRSVRLRQVAHPAPRAEAQDEDRRRAFRLHRRAAPTAPSTPAGPPTSTRRVAQHNAGRGARYTRVHRPVALVYREEVPDRSSRDAARGGNKEARPGAQGAPGRASTLNDESSFSPWRPSFPSP